MSPHRFSRERFLGDSSEFAGSGAFSCKMTFHPADYESQLADIQAEYEELWAAANAAA